MATGERGLVISNPIKIDGDTMYSEHSWLDEQELRFSLLFWDKLDFPDNNFISSWGGQGSDFLQKAGVLNRTKVRFQGSENAGSALIKAHLGAFRFLDEREPGVWSLGSGRNSLVFPDQDLDAGRGALFRLHQAIPVPDKDVPLADVLEFRTKRRDELLALRYHLEGVYERIINAGDGDLAINRETETLETAIADHIKTSKETGFRLRLADMDAGLNLLSIAAGGFVAYKTGLPLLSGLLRGAVSGLSIDIGAGLKRRKPVATPFQYISSYNKELF
ncbi:MAG TPA: DUF6236 family protein [Rhizomicrobium sp.]|jgi:hypothetical protein|nr:DUF6236 family protein [Rhizomicrobium sp.]